MQSGQKYLVRDLLLCRTGFQPVSIFTQPLTLYLPSGCVWELGHSSTICFTVQTAKMSARVHITMSGIEPSLLTQSPFQKFYPVNPVHPSFPRCAVTREGGFATFC